MKKIYLYIAAAAVLAGMTACREAEYSVLEGQGFIAQTQTRANASQVVTVGNKNVSADLNIRLSSPAPERVTFSVAPDEAALKAFNDRNATTYVLLPAGSYTLTDQEGNAVSSTEIAAGQTMSPTLRVQVSPLTEDMVNSGQKYALALTARSTDGKTDMIASASTMVYAIDRVVIQSVPVIFYNKSNGTQVFGTFGEREVSFTEWTWECNLNIDNLGEGIGRLNNQALNSMSLSNEIYIRFGDAPIDGRVLQIKTQGTQMESQMQFAKNTWYHIAFVCTGNKLYLYVNGELDNSMDLPGVTYQFTKNGTDPIGDADFSIAATDYFKANMMIAEWRFWTVARSQAQIQNNMYSCDPSTPGLLGYFKFNEGEGKDFADATGKGGHATCALGTPAWVPNVRIDGKPLD